MGGTDYYALAQGGVAKKIAGNLVVTTTDPQTLTGKTIACANNICTVRIGSDVSGLGTGVATALGVNVGSAGAPVVFNGALGTPSSGTLTSATGLPIGTGLTGAGTGVLTALGVNVGSAGAPVINGGALGTPSSGTGTNITGVVNNNVLAVTLATGTSVTLTAPREYYICTSTCTVTPPVPAAGYEFCIRNGNNVSTVITMAAIGSSARYENQAHTAYGTAGTGTLVSAGAAGDQVCLLGLDSTHYLFASGTGVWTAN